MLGSTRFTVRRDYRVVDGLECNQKREAEQGSLRPASVTGEISLLLK